MLALVCFAACLACGPVTSFPTFEPMLCKLGVLGSTHNATSDTSQTSPQLDLVYNMGQGTVLVLGQSGG